MRLEQRRSIFAVTPFRYARMLFRRPAVKALDASNIERRDLSLKTY